MKWVLIISSFFVVTGCFEKKPRRQKATVKTLKSLTEDQKAMMRAVEEKSIRLVALDLGISCENLESFREQSAKTLGFKELLNFIKTECEGLEPSLPTRIPAKCRDQVEVPVESPGVVPGLEVNSHYVRKHNLSQCACPVEYKLIEETELPLCLLNIATN